jgi:hypothetical protein
MTKRTADCDIPRWTKQSQATKSETGDKKGNHTLSYANLSLIQATIEHLTGHDIASLLTTNDKLVEQTFFLAAGRLGAFNDDDGKRNLWEQLALWSVGRLAGLYANDPGLLNIYSSLADAITSMKAK